jgi:CheY-like chemotaxis protein
VPLVLVLEPDLRQAAILKRVIRQEVRAELLLVDSRDAAIAALSTRVPDVVLLTALLSPRDEEELINHLRSLAGAEHLQTHTIPQLASSLRSEDGRSSGGGGLLGKFRRKKEAEPMPGCDPALFAAEVRAFLDRAAELKSESVVPLIARPPETEDAVPAPVVEDPASREREQPAAPTSWDSPFEWRGSGPLRGPTPIEEVPATEEVGGTILREEPVLAEAEPETLQAQEEAGTDLRRDQDPFATFREDADEERAGVLRFLPLALWARREQPRAPAPQPPPGGELRELLASLSLSPHVSGVAYPRGCRIRRVRVPAAPRTRAAHPVILSRRTLEEMRAAERR